MGTSRDNSSATITTSNQTTFREQAHSEFKRGASYLTDNPGRKDHGKAIKAFSSAIDAISHIDQQELTLNDIKDKNYLLLQMAKSQNWLANHPPKKYSNIKKIKLKAIELKAAVWSLFQAEKLSRYPKINISDQEMQHLKEKELTFEELNNSYKRSLVQAKHQLAWEIYNTKEDSTKKVINLMRSALSTQATLEPLPEEKTELVGDIKEKDKLEGDLRFLKSVLEKEKHPLRVFDKRKAELNPDLNPEDSAKKRQRVEKSSP